MFNNYMQNNGYDYNECTSRGACSISPNVSSLQEVMLIILRQIAFYTLKLQNMDIDVSEIKIEIVEEILMFDSVSEYSEEQLLNMLGKQYSNLIKIRKKYIEMCKERDITCNDLKNILKISPDMNLSSIIKKGEKAFLDKLKKVTTEQKYLSEIMISVLKSVSCNIVIFSEFDKVHVGACDEVIKALNLFNTIKIPTEDIKNQTIKLAEINIELFKLIFNAKINSYGEINETEVSMSTKPNKAVLVSGSNLSDLHSVLCEAEGSDVDVYSNGNLLIAHAFDDFKEFNNFKGHFGNGTESFILDFATFPGSILLTKNEAKNIEYLYRGRLFTTDKIVPKGVVQIKDNNFKELIESAEQSKGFAKGQERKVIKIGYNNEKLNKKLDEISKKFNNGEYKHLFILGLSSYSTLQQDYFKKFFKLIPKDSFVLSFSYGENTDNSLVLNLANDYSMVLNVLARLFDKIAISSDNLSFFLTKCDVNTLSNIINLKNRGAKNIFLTDCPPTIINPMVLKEFTKIYNINNTSTPKADLEFLLKNLGNN